MSEQTTTTNNNGQPTPPEAPVNPVENWRDQPGAKAMAAKIAQLEAEAAQRKAAEDEAKAKAEEERMKAQNDYEGLKKLNEDRVKQIEAESKAKIRGYQLEAAFAGIQDEFRRKGVIASCPPDMDPAEYAKKMRTDHPDLFEVLSFQQNGTTPTVQRGLNGVSADWVKTKAEFNNGTPQQVLQATDRIQKYMAANGGKMPPGF